ncbi:MAG: LLM class flavin-dependent oxidoreductase [Terrimicrobiaceae bacterium]
MIHRRRDPFLSVLDLCPILAGTSAADALARSLDLARLTEKLGYRRYWVAEHHSMPGIASAATSVVIGHIAGSTSTIRVGSGGIMLLNHSPLVVAEQFGTLESLYPGRIDLGLGRAPGTDQATMRFLRRNSNGTAEEFPQRLEELRSFFRSPTSGQRVRAVPGAGLKVPIWLLGSGGFSAQLAGELGLPFASAGHFVPDNILPGLELYRRSFRPSADLDRPCAMVGINVFAAEDDKGAERLATSHFQAHLKLAQGIPTELPPPANSLEEVWKGPLAKSSFLRSSIIGGPSTVEAGLRSLVEMTNADELIIHSMIFDHEARRRSYEIVWQVAGSMAPSA